MVNNEDYSTAVMTEIVPSSPIVVLPSSEARVEAFAAAVMSDDVRSNRNLRQLLQETGLVNPVHDWSNYRALNTREIPSVPHIVFLELGRQSDLEFARDLRKVQPDIHLIACSDQKEPRSLSHRKL